MPDVVRPVFLPRAPDKHLYRRDEQGAWWVKELSWPKLVPLAEYVADRLAIRDA